MKLLITLLSFIILWCPGFGQPERYMSDYDRWKQESEVNKRLLPRFGDLTKTPQEIEADSAFTQSIMSQPEYNSRRAASNHLIDLGFQYYYKGDIRTAMYRFNQAYLLDSTNAEIYWGYGAVFMHFGMLGLAADQYHEGLRREPTNTHLLTDLGTLFLVQYNRLEFEESLDSAIIFMRKSYEIDPMDQNTLFKLSVSYWQRNDCENAWKYYNKCKELGGKPITDDYTRDLKKTCNIKK